MKTKHTILLALFSAVLLFNLSFAQYAVEKMETATADGSPLKVSSLMKPIVMSPKSPNALSGPYTIGGASPDYATFTLAVTDLVAQGVSGPVIFNVRPGTYAEGISIDPVSGASATNTITFQKESGSVALNAAGSASTGDAMVILNGCDYITFDGIDISDGGTSSTNQVEYGYVLQTQGGLGTDGATYNVIKNCSILLGGGGSVPGFSHGVLISNIAAAVASNSFNAIRNVTIDRSDRGIGLFGQFDSTNPPTAPDNGNEISGCTLGQTTYLGNNLATGGSAIGIIPSAQINMLIFNNKIYSVRLNNTANTGGVTGIAVQTSSGLVYNNQILQVYQASTASSTARAIGIQTGAIASGTVKFYNNFISGINKGYTGAASATFSVFGIRSTNFAGGGGANEYYYNTIYLNSASPVTYASVVFGTFAGGVQMVTKNNIFVNAISTSSATARAAVIQDANGSSSGFLTSNNNCFAASGTNGVIGVNLATTYRTSLADWQANNTGLDGNSFVEVPPFINVASLPYNLHINTAVGTQVESRGTIISGITTDIDGDLRFGAGGYGGTGTAPDVGADEGNFIFLDITPPSIAYSPLLNTSSTSSRSIVVTVTDGSGVPNTAPGWPYLYWRINAGSWNATAPTSVVGSQYTYNLGSGVVTGDIVYYYVVAQDQAATPNVGAFPSVGAGGFSINPPAASTPPTTPSSYKITSAGLSGLYTVGLNLFNKLIGRNIYFEKEIKIVQKEVSVSALEKIKGTPEQTAIDLSANRNNLMEVEEIGWIPMENGKPYTGPLYISKSENPQINFPAGVEGVYSTITLALADLNEKGLSGAVTFSLVDNSYPTETFPLAVDIFNVNATTAVNTLMIKPAATITPAITGAAANSQIFLIKNSYVTIDGSNSGGTDRSITLTNSSATVPQVVRIASGTTQITNVTVKNCVLINGVNTSSAIVVNDLSGTSGNFNNITIQNNNVQKAYIGIFCNAATGFGNNLLVTDNDLNTSGTNAIRYIGIYAQGFDGVNISKNNIANFDGASGEDDRGIWLASGSVNGVIENNVIHSLNYTGGIGYGVHGIAVSSATTNANHVIKNNMISNLSADGWTYTTSDYADNPFGIYIFGTQTGVKVYYNSIYLSGNTLNQTNALSAGIVLGTGSTANIRNNIIVNNLGLSAATGFGSTGIFLQSSASQLEQSNYNDISVLPSGSGAALIGNIGSSNNYSTLASWQSATSQDANSKSVTVAFSGSTDLHLTGGSVGDGNLMGTPLAGITTDIDNQTRNAVAPYMGADEIPGSPLVRSLNLTALIEGFWDGSSMVSDTVTVELHNTTNPWALVDQAKVVLNSSGNNPSVNFFSAADAVDYYLVVKHRNSIETWSKLPQQFTGGALTYDFTTGAAQAYGNNLKLKSGKYCIYSGDVNGSGTINVSDINAVFAASNLGLTGYVVTDVNGSNTVNVTDINITYANSNLGVSVQKPTVLSTGKEINPVEQTSTNEIE